MLVGRKTWRCIALLSHVHDDGVAESVVMGKTGASKIRDAATPLIPSVLLLQSCKVYGVDAVA